MASMQGEWASMLRVFGDKVLSVVEGFQFWGEYVQFISP